MIRVYLLIFSCLLFVSGVPFAQAEVINNFDVTYQINPDATVVVKETITYDFEGENRHGIFRIIKSRHPQGASVWYKQRLIDIKVERVLKDGKAEPFETTTGFSEVEIKVGDPDITTSGQHVYQIEYQLVGALSYGPQGAEFYWNVTGNDWPVVIESVTATVYSSAVTGLSACYRGQIGSTQPCGSNLTGPGTVTFTQSALLLGEGLTIASALDASKVAVVNAERFSFFLLGVMLTPLWLLVIGIWLYRARTSAYLPQPVIAQYEPYAGYLPMYTGVLSDGRLDPRDITAGILYLAEQGYIKITKTERKVLLVVSITDYDLTLVRYIPNTLGEFLPAMAKLLFPEGTFVGTTFALSSLASHKIDNAAILTALQTNIKKDLVTLGFRDASTQPYTAQVLTLIITSAVIFLPFWMTAGGFIFWLGMVVITTLITCSVYIARISKEGYIARNYIAGFKLFLSVTDRERFDFHNAPEKSPELFMKYLPYAVALGVESKWAKVFEGITIPTPDWYQGGNLAAFNAAALTSDLGAFSSAFAASSGVSASSGGGSSGGGGGGGGGGSW